MVLCEALLNGEHPIEGDLGPVLLAVGNHDAVVHLTVDEPFERPQQMIRRHAEHGRAEAAELIEGQHGTVGLHLMGEAIDEMNLGADGPHRTDGTGGHLIDDVFRRTAIVGGLDDIGWAVGRLATAEQQPWLCRSVPGPAQSQLD